MKNTYGVSLVKFLLLGCIAIMDTATAASLPKGNCSAPHPYTDLRHCDFEKADLSNKDLRGTDLRVASLYQTDFDGADLTNALFDRNQLLAAQFEGAKGLPKDILDTLSLYSVINDKNFRVTRNANSTITLSPHEGVQGIQEDIAGLANIQLLSRVANRQHTIAVLDWPRDNDYKNVVIVSRFDNDKFDMPACYQSLKLLDDRRYYNAHWTSMKVKPLTNGGYLIGIRASGGDSDELDISGWDMVAFLKLTPTCNLSVLHREDNSWLEKPDHTRCHGTELDYRFLDEQTAEILMTAHTCGTAGKSKAKVTSKKIKLN